MRSALKVELGEERDVVRREERRGKRGVLLHLAVLHHLEQSTHAQPVHSVEDVVERAHEAGRGKGVQLVRVYG